MSIYYSRTELIDTMKNGTFDDLVKCILQWSMKDFVFAKHPEGEGYDIENKSYGNPIWAGDRYSVKEMLEQHSNTKLLTELTKRGLLL